MVCETEAFAASLLCWTAECWLALSVAIDASLFRFLAEGDPEAAGKTVDELLVHVGIRRPQQDRKLADRSRGPLRLWLGQIAACTVQLAPPIAAGVLRSRSL